MMALQKEIEAVYNEVLNYPAADRLERGKALCAGDEELWHEVRTLLEAADKAQGFLSNGAQGEFAQGASALDSDALRGQRFGAYEIIDEIDRGGMGVIFRAIRVDGHYKSKVAIKVAASSLDSADTVQRFHAERQILAHLRHPNIAQLLDGGNSDGGLPYLVMEYIQGDPIDHYCALQRLSVEQVLLLMEAVCDAVQYAHQNLVVHCDLKPANILVTSEGVPKLLDFGIATLLNPALTSRAAANEACDSQTLSPGQIPFTPEFAAPEQFAGVALTTAADVYALGAVLYKLLTGRLPARSSGTTQQLPGSAALVAPSAVAPQWYAKQLRGDLDNIVLKAMDVDPQRRYSSVQMLSEDIRSFIQRQPVQATRQTVRYMAGRFYQRHRVGVLMGAVTAMSLLIGSVLSTWQWHNAREKAYQSEYQLNKIQELTKLVVFELPQNIASLHGSTELREQLISRGVEYLDELVAIKTDDSQLWRELANAYVQLAKLQGSPGNIHLGDPELAHSNYEKAMIILERLHKESPDSIELRLELSNSYRRLSTLRGGYFANLESAQQLSERCLMLMQSGPFSERTDVLNRLAVCYLQAAHWYNAEGKHDKARSHLVAIEHLFSSIGDAHPLLQSSEGWRMRARMHEEWAELSAQAGELQQALQHERDRAAIFHKHLRHSNKHERYQGVVHHALAARLAALQRYEEADDAYSTAIVHWQTLQQAYPSDVGATQTLMMIHAERAELNLSIANEAVRQETREQARERICASYSSSLMNYARLPPVQDEVPQRYSWSPQPAEIIEAQQRHCPQLTSSE